MMEVAAAVPAEGATPSASVVEGAVVSPIAVVEGPIGVVVIGVVA
jgi:hypothetical protein